MKANDPAIRALTPIWISLLAAVAIYGVIAWSVVHRPGVEPGGAFSQAPVIALYVAAAAAFVASFVLSRLVARGSKARTPKAPSAYKPITEASRTAVIVRWTLMESVAILGLVGAFMTGDRIVFLPLGLLAFSGILFSAPTVDRLRSIAGSGRPSQR